MIFEESPYFLGLALFYGIGVDQNKEEALKYFRQSAERGFSDAQLALALALFEAKGTPLE